ncbi:MFS transporter [Dickeya zeae]|uniref:MFS transporter n=1 Tax=Dickeya zeae TaxID=204042 RepID=UPI0014402E06|nr:MFS transporter [Dickeya zeae]QIZ47379.1 MFS transporter [Dickeya zeae]
MDTQIDKPSAPSGLTSGHVNPSSLHNPALEGTKPQRNYRWVVCSMLVFATTVNYMDRQILGLLAPMLQKDIGWTEMEYSWLVNAFTVAYGIGTLVCGRIIDKLGTKISYAVAMVVWSTAAMLHAVAGSVIGFAVVRVLLGLGESANFPAAMKVIAEWHPKKERTLATGILGVAVNIGVVISPALIPLIAIHYGWQGAFLILGAVGFLWLIPWFLAFGPVKAKTSVEEQAWIAQDKEEIVNVSAIKWSRLLGYRQLWAVALGKMLTDPIWWFFLFWLPKWLHESRGIDMKGLGLPLIVIYLFAIVGSLGAGWLPGKLMSKGFSTASARKITMLICACLVLPIFAATQVENLWAAVALVGLAAAAHQGWSANILTSVSDLFPSAAVGSVVGIGSTFGMIGSVIFSTVIGAVLDASGNYWALFAISSVAYLLAWAVMYLLLVPKMERASFD